MEFVSVLMPTVEESNLYFHDVIRDVIDAAYGQHGKNRSSGKTNALHPPIMKHMEQAIGPRLEAAYGSPCVFVAESGNKLTEPQRSTGKKDAVSGKLAHSLDVDGRVLDPLGASTILMSAKFNFLSVAKNLKNLRRNMKGEIGDIKDIAFERAHIYHTAYFVNFCNDHDLLFSGDPKVLKGNRPFQTNSKFYESNYTNSLLRNIKVLDIYYRFVSDLKIGDPISRLHQIVAAGEYSIVDVNTSSMISEYNAFSPKY
jgi:hypothetical protein